MSMKMALVIPTLDSGPRFAHLLASLALQTRQPDECILLDSESTDDTVRLAVGAGFSIVPVSRATFDHGGTRQLGSARTEADVIIFMTQDAVLSGATALEGLLRCFEGSSVGAAYGRQLPQHNAGPAEAHARLFNYPAISRIVSVADVPRLGIKTAFLSDSFAAYRKKALVEVGGFPLQIILGEDMVVGAKLLLAGWNIAYCADAAVVHSHQYSMIQEFRRYFDTGVLHSQESWLLNEFGGAGGEGIRFVRSEVEYLWNTGNIRSIPQALIHNGLKCLGYRLGRLERILPLRVKKLVSMNCNYWTSCC